MWLGDFSRQFYLAPSAHEVRKKPFPTVKYRKGLQEFDLIVIN